MPPRPGPDSGSGGSGGNTLPAGHTYTPINETTVIDENGQTYYVGPDVGALQKIAAVAGAHPDWKQVDETHWRTPGGIIHELLADGNGNPILGGAWTAADSRAYLSSVNQSPASGGGGGGGGGSSPAPKAPTAAQVKADGPYYGFTTPSDASNFANQIGGATPEQLAALQQIAAAADAKKVATLTGQKAKTGGKYYGFDTPEQAQAYAASIANASPEQLGALQYISQQSGGSSGGSGTNAYDQQISQANLDLAYAKMTFDEKQQAAQLQYQYMNAGLDANAARQQALATLIANKTNNATNVAQASQAAAAQAAQFAANPRDAVAELMYRNAQGLTSTPMGSTSNPAFADYQGALSQKFMDLFGGAAGDMQKAREQRDAPLPGEFSTPISVNAPQLSTSTYKAPQLGAITPPAASAPPPATPTQQNLNQFAAQQYTKDPAAFKAWTTATAPQAAAPAAPKQDANRAALIKSYAAYHPDDAAAQMQAAWLAYHPDEAIPFAKGGTITMNNKRPMNMLPIGDTVSVPPSTYTPPNGLDPYRAIRTPQLPPIGHQPIEGGGLGIINPTVPRMIPDSSPSMVGDHGNPMTPQIAPMGIPETAAPIVRGPIPGVWNGRQVVHSAQNYGLDFSSLPRGTAYPGAPTGFHPDRTGVPRWNAPQQYAEGGNIGQTMDGYRPASSSGGTNMNIHELSYVVGAKSGHVYATLGEHGYPEQLKITPTKEGKEYAQMLDKQKKMAAQGGDGDQQMAKQFAAGGTVTIGADFIAGLRKSLQGYDKQAQAVGGQALPDPRLLAAGVYNQTQHDPNLKGYIESAYSSQGISPEQLWSTVDQFRPQGLSNTSVRYA